MPPQRKPRRFDLDSIVLDGTKRKTLQSQLRDQLQRAILQGRLSPGEKIPSSRAMALSLGVGRITVATVYEQLISEGYLVARVGSGTRVSPRLPEELLTVSRKLQFSPTSVDVSHLSRRGREIAGFQRLTQHDRGSAVPFRPHVPAIDLFPRHLWERLVNRRQRLLPRSLMAKVDAKGYLPLREAVAGYLGASRGVRCTPDEIVITAGAQQGIDLVSRMLLDPDDRVWMEEPGYLVAKPSLEAAGAKIVYVPVDNQGLDVASGERLSPKPRLIYVTPSCQWPTGVTMSLPRRLELLASAQRSGAWILEDDYAGEFRYQGQPLSALQGLDRTGRVIYMGTFSKVLFPSLRLAYLVVPSGIADAFGVARWFTDRHSPPLEQAVLADFIDGGHFARHLRQMRTLYAERQGAVVESARRELAGAISVPPLESGMHLVGTATGVSQQILGAAANQANINYHLMSWFSATASTPGLILGYAPYSPKESQRAMKSWSKALLSPHNLIT